MTESPSPPLAAPSGTLQPGVTAAATSVEQPTETSPPPAAAVSRGARSSACISEEFQDLTFLTSDTFYRARLPKSLHWSIVWSDLMMTMFILFLSMYAYQMAHEEFLVNKKPEVIGGSTTDAMDISLAEHDIAQPTPETNLQPLTTGSIKKVETVEPVTGVAMTPEEEKKISRFDIIDAFVQQEKKAEKAVKEERQPQAPETVIEPAPLPTSPVRDGAATPSSLGALYDLSRQAVDKNNLQHFASIDLVPDTTMRIILSGDLLFATGKADFSTSARQSLQMIATAIKDTPYMINVTGHTDNLPMHSDRFNTNWELSVARASQVARFLIEEARMNPNQFVVSGYSSYRPIRPNTTSENRASNRRVEITISKKLPPAAQVEPGHLRNTLPQ